MIIIVLCVLCLLIGLYKIYTTKKEEVFLKKKWLDLELRKDYEKKAARSRVDSITSPLLKSKFQKAVAEIDHLVAKEYPDGCWQFFYNNVGTAFCLKGSYFHIKVTSTDFITETRTVLLSHGEVIGLEGLENAVTTLPSNKTNDAKIWFNAHKDDLWKSTPSIFTIPKEMYPLEIAEDICEILIENGFNCAIPSEKGITVETD